MSLLERKWKASEDLTTATKPKHGHTFESININGGCNVLGDYHASQPSAYQRLLDSLSYREMNARFNDVTDPSEANFEWILPNCHNSSDETQDSNATHKFTDWLRNDSSIFWISGKPGSGKSTLMKYLAGHLEVKRILKDQNIAPPLDVVIISHYFWMAGSPLQYNMRGCVLHLCWQLLRTRKGSECVDNDIEMGTDLQVYLQQYLNTISPKRYLEDWSIRELESLLNLLLKSAPYKVCIFLDGLDEYDQNRNLSEILSLISRLTQSLHHKVCVSSRSELSLEASLQRHSHIHIHNYTLRDITDLARSRLNTAVAASNFYQFTDQDIILLSREIARNAEGVFVWALLAIESTIEGMSRAISTTMLLENLTAMPRALNDCYEAMLARAAKKNGPVEVRIQKLFETPIDAWICFNVMYLSLGVLQVSRDHAKMSSYTLAQWLQDTDYLRRQVYAQSAGLLQLNDWPTSVVLQELVSQHRDVQLGWLFEILVPELATIIKSSPSDTDMGRVLHLVRLLRGDKSTRPYLAAKFKPIHRTVHDFFLNRARENTTVQIDISSSILVGRSLPLPILLTIVHSFEVSYTPRSDLTYTDLDYSEESLFQATLAYSTDISLRSTILDAVAEFVELFVRRNPIQDLLMVTYLEPLSIFAPSRDLLVDVTGFVHGLGFNLISRPALSIIYNASRYYKSFLISCSLLPSQPRSFKEGWWKPFLEVVSMFDGDVDLMTPHVFTDKECIIVLSLFSRYLIYILGVIVYADLLDNASTEQLSGVVAKLSHYATKLSGRDQSDPNSGFEPPRQHFGESSMLLKVRNFTPEGSSSTYMRMSTKGLLRLVSDLIIVWETKDPSQMLALSEYGLLPVVEMSDQPMMSDDFCRQALCHKLLGLEGRLSNVYFRSETKVLSDSHALASFKVPETTFAPVGNDYYFKGVLRDWHEKREKGEITASKELMEWEALSGLVPDYERKKLSIPECSTAEGRECAATEHVGSSNLDVN